ncbi:MAG: hypothetical protein AB1488_06670 [Nitrospirota bacterium]
MLKIDIKKYKKYAFVFLGIIGVSSLATIIYINSQMKSVPERPPLFTKSDKGFPVKAEPKQPSIPERKEEAPQTTVKIPVTKVYDIFRKEDIEKQERKERISKAEDEAKLEAIMTEIKKKKREGELTEVEAKVKKGTLESSLIKIQGSIALPGFEMKEEDKEPVLEVSGIINTGKRMTAIAVYGRRRYNIIDGAQIGTYKIKRITYDYVLVEKDGMERMILPSASMRTSSPEQRYAPDGTYQRHPQRVQPFPFPIEKGSISPVPSTMP